MMLAVLVLMSALMAAASPASAQVDVCSNAEAKELVEQRVASRTFRHSGDIHSVAAMHELYKDCAWFQAAVCSRETSVRTSRATNPDALWGPGSTHLNYYSGCSWYASVASATTQAPAFEPPSRQILPIYRWNVSALRRFDPQGDGVLDNIMSLLVTMIGSLGFGIASFLWAISRELMAVSAGLSDGVFRMVAPVVNSVFADIGRTVQSFFTVALLVVGLSAARAYLSGRKVTEALRNIVILIIFGAIFLGISSTTQRAVDNGGDDLAVGTAAWVGATVVGLGDSLTAPVSQRLAGGDRLELDGVREMFPGQDVPDTSCAAYAALLHADAADAGVPGVMRMLSSLWENTYLAAFQRAQFGDSGRNDLPGRAICHFADDQNNVPRAERFRYVSRLAPGAYVEGSPFFSSHDSVSDVQLGEAVTAAAACQYTGSDGWQPLDHYERAVTAENCERLFTSSANKIQSVAGDGDGDDKAFLLFGQTRFWESSVEERLASPPAPSDEALTFALSLTPRASAVLPPLLGGLSSVLSAAAVMLAFGLMSIAMILSGALALISVGFLFPLLLLLLAVQSKKAKKVGQLAASLLTVNVFVQLLMFAIMALSILIQSVMSPIIGGVPILSDFLFGLAPLAALFIVDKLLKASGFGGLRRFSDVASLPMLMAARMSGVKSLQDLSREQNGQNAFHRLANKFGSVAPGLQKLADKDQENSLGGMLYKNIDGKKGRVGGLLDRVTERTEARRRWESEQKDRADLNEAQEEARLFNLKQPTSAVEALQTRKDIQKIRARRDASDLYAEYEKRKKSGELEQWAASGDPELQEKARILEEYGLLGANYIPDSLEAKKVLMDAKKLLPEADDPSPRSSQIVEQYGPPGTELVYAAGGASSIQRSHPDPGFYEGLDRGSLEHIPTIPDGILSSAGLSLSDPAENVQILRERAQAEYGDSLSRELADAGYATVMEIADPKERLALQERARAAVAPALLAVGCRASTGGYSDSGLNGGARMDAVLQVSERTGIPSEALACSQMGLVYIRPTSSISVDPAEDLPRLAQEIQSLHSSAPEEAQRAVSSFANFVPENIRSITSEPERERATIAWGASVGLVDLTSGTTVDMAQKFGIDPANPAEGLSRVKAYLDEVAQTGAVNMQKRLQEALDKAAQNYETISAAPHDRGQLDFFAESLNRGVGAGTLRPDYTLDEDSFRSTVARVSEGLAALQSGAPAESAAAAESMLPVLEQMMQHMAAVSSVKVAAETITLEGVRPEAHVSRVRDREQELLGALAAACTEYETTVRSGVLKPSSQNAKQQAAAEATAQLSGILKWALGKVEKVDLASTAAAAAGVEAILEKNRLQIAAGGTLADRARAGGVPQVRESEVGLWLG